MVFSVYSRFNCMAHTSEVLPRKAALPAALSVQLRKLKQRSKRGAVLTLVDLFSLETLRHLRKVDCAVYTVSSADESKEFVKADINPSLSFRLAQGKIFFFRYSTDFSDLASPASGQSNPDTKTYKIRTAKVLIHSEVHDLVVNKYIADGIAIVLESGLYQSNFQRDVQRRHISDLKSAIAASRGHFGLPQIVAFLTGKGLPSALLHLPNLRSVQINVLSSEPSTVGDIFLAIGKRPPSITARDRFFSANIGESYGGRRLIDAARWGKPIIYGLETHNVIKHILFAPVARPYLIPQGRQDGHSVVCRDIICLSLSTLNRKKITEVQDYLEYFSYYRFTERRFETANAIYRSLKALREEKPSEAPLSRSELGRRLASFSQEHLEAVLYTTSAHSVTLRIFDPTRAALVPVAYASSEENQPRSIGELRNIDVDKLRWSSVNAFTFADGGTKFNYVYLPRIPDSTPPDPHQSRKKTSGFIPLEYSRNGLQGVLSTRPDTRCEICFPIIMGEACVATMNCEAPIYHGFDDDISYLTTVKEGFEAFLSDVMGRFDITWLLRQGWRADAVHELWQYIETGSTFSREISMLLKRLFPDPRVVEPAELKKFGALEEQLTSWVNDRYGIASTDGIFAMLKFRLPREILVPSLYLDTLYFISRNIIQNAIQHTEISGSMIYFDLTMLRHTSAVRIHFRTRALLYPIPSDTMDQLILSPVTDRVGRKRYGLFIVGLLARLLGGTAEAMYDSAASELIIKVMVPIREVTS
jgi:hypothetical protein